MLNFVFKLDDDIPMVYLFVCECVIEASDPVIRQIGIEGYTISLIPRGVIMAEISVQQNDLLILENDFYFGGKGGVFDFLHQQFIAIPILQPKIWEREMSFRPNHPLLYLKFKDRFVDLTEKLSVPANPDLSAVAGSSDVIVVIVHGRSIQIEVIDIPWRVGLVKMTWMPPNQGFGLVFIELIHQEFPFVAVGVGGFLDHLDELPDTFVVKK
jgi:hypothetical protein